MSSYSLKYPNITEAIITDCKICAPVDYLNGKLPDVIFDTHNAMWDTGATNTLISSEVVKRLGLQPYGKVGISSANGVVETNAYLVHVGLPSGYVATNIVALEDDNEDYEVVIGMDIITLGDLAFTNNAGHSTFSFRIPSKEDIYLN